MEWNKPLYLQTDMARLLKIILLLLFVVACGSITDSLFTGKTVDMKGCLCYNEGVVDQGHAYVSAPDLPYLPDAELAGPGAHSQLLNSCRVQRSYTEEYIFSVKGWVDMLAQREATLSLHREKLFDTTACLRSCSVCEYYVYTLRRIII